VLEAVGDKGENIRNIYVWVGMVPPAKLHHYVISNKHSLKCNEAPQVSSSPQRSSASNDESDEEFIHDHDHDEAEYQWTYKSGIDKARLKLLSESVAEGDVNPESNKLHDTII